MAVASLLLFELARSKALSARKVTDTTFMESADRLVDGVIFSQGQHDWVFLSGSFFSLAHVGNVHLTNLCSFYCSLYHDQ